MKLFNSGYSPESLLASVPAVSSMARRTLISRDSSSSIEQYARNSFRSLSDSPVKAEAAMSRSCNSISRSVMFALLVAVVLGLVIFIIRHVEGFFAVSCEAVLVLRAAMKGSVLLAVTRRPESFPLTMEARS